MDLSRGNHATHIVQTALLQFLGQMASTDRHRPSVVEPARVEQRDARQLGIV